MDIIILNSKPWDRTIEALWKNLKSQKRNGNWNGFKMPEDFQILTSYVAEHYDDIDSLTLLGSFCDWENDDNGISITLKDIFANAKIPRVWVMLFDLHHTVNDLLHGTKSSIKRDTNGVTSIQIDPTLFFDCLAWGYEHVDFHNAPQESSFSDKKQYFEATRTFRLAQETWLNLCRYFPSRLAFYHCLDIGEISRLKPSNLFRIYDLAIPGTLYATRLRARDLFFKSKFSITPSESISKFYGKLIQVLITLYKVWQVKNENRKREIKRKLSFSQLHTICQLSRFVWVDGSYLRYPVRKYFEIPALNAILMSPDNSAIKELGIFEDWQFSEPEYLLDLTAKFNNLGSFERKRLVERQKNKLLRFHTAAVRLQSLSSYIRYYQPDSSTLGYYRQGELIFERNGKSVSGV
jgi:hypothetical protein